MNSVKKQKYHAKCPLSNLASIADSGQCQGQLATFFFLKLAIIFKCLAKMQKRDKHKHFILQQDALLSLHPYFCLFCASSECLIIIILIIVIIITWSHASVPEIHKSAVVVVVVVFCAVGTTALEVLVVVVVIKPFKI